MWLDPSYLNSLRMWVGWKKNTRFCIQVSIQPWTSTKRGRGISYPQTAAPAPSPHSCLSEEKTSLEQVHDKMLMVYKVYLYLCVPWLITLFGAALTWSQEWKRECWSSWQAAMGNTITTSARTCWTVPDLTFFWCPSLSSDRKAYIGKSNSGLAFFALSGFRLLVVLQQKEGGTSSGPFLTFYLLISITSFLVN